MSVVLSEHLPQLATAPDGIQKLRGLILELAVRGKLVPQDPNDEPASELLKRIAQERARLEADGTCRKSKATPIVSDEDVPFELPVGWSWTRLGAVANAITKGATPTTYGHSYKNTGIRFVKVENISNRRIASANGFQFIDEETDRVLCRSRLEAGDVLFSIAGTIGKTCLVTIEDLPANTNQALAIIKGTGGTFHSDFLLNQLDSVAGHRTRAKARGGAMSNVSLGDLVELVLAVPPLAEQHRIVAKVDELMALCDRLEAEQADAEAAHAKLVDSLLDTLTQSTDAADLPANWQRLAEHFDTLFTTESSLDALKQTILQLGVSGRLTNTNAFEPLKLGDLLIDACYGTSHKCDSTRINGACPVLRIPNVIQETLDLIDLKFAVLEEKELQKVLLRDGDVVVVRTNGSAELVGRCAVVKGLPENAAFASYMIRLRFDPSRVDPEFAQRTLRNHRLQNRMIDFARTTAGQYNVSIGRLRELEMPIPSLAEQHRIVAKVDELMAICDRLKADLAESRRRQERLTSTLIESALKAA